MRDGDAGGVELDGFWVLPDDFSVDIRREGVKNAGAIHDRQKDMRGLNGLADGNISDGTAHP